MPAHLLHTDDFDAAKAEIDGGFGYVTIQVSDSLLVAVLDGDPATLGLVRSTHRIPDALDEESARGARAWGIAERILADRREAKRVPWDAPGRKPPYDVEEDVPAERRAGAVGGAPFVPVLSETLTGVVAVRYILVGGPGSLSFTPDQALDLLGQMLASFQILASFYPPGSVTFKYRFDDYQLTVANTGSCTSSTKDDCEKIWRDPLLKALNVTPTDWRGVAKMAQAIKDDKKADWGYVAFMTKYNYGWFAYTRPANTARYVVQGYDNDGWGSDQNYRTFVHESCHVFNAQDEYQSSPCTCVETGGVHAVPNGNCINCAAFHVTCAMTHHEFDLCTYTQGQLGWSQPKGLVALFQGAHDDGLWTIAAEDYVWQPKATPVPNVTIGGPPAAAVLGGTLVATFKGAHDDGLWYATYSSAAGWSPQAFPVAGVALSGRPSMAPLPGAGLMTLFKGAYDAGLWYATYDGGVWSGSFPVPNVTIGSSPAAALFQGVLYVLFRGANDEGLWYVTYSAASGWSPQAIPITGVQLSGSPAAAATADRLIVAFHGVHDDGLYYVGYQGAAWLPPEGGLVGNVRLGDSPSAATVDGSVFVGFHGAMDAGLWYAAYYAGKGWAQYATPVANVSIGGDPAFAFLPPSP